MRYLVCLVVGILIGALCTTMVARVLAQREDPWPHAIMQVMRHELKQARNLAKPGQCATPAANSALQHLQLMANDIEPALLTGIDEQRVFKQYASDLRKEIDRAIASVDDCTVRSDAVTAIDHACDACHRDYR